MESQCGEWLLVELVTLGHGTFETGESGRGKAEQAPPVPRRGMPGALVTFVTRRESLLREAKGGWKGGKSARGWTKQSWRGSQVMDEILSGWLRGCLRARVMTGHELRVPGSGERMYEYTGLV